MTVEFLNYISKSTFETILLVGGPVLIVSLLIGLLIGLFQAITQLQEMTISFVPKVIAVFNNTPYNSLDGQYNDEVHEGNF